MDGQAHALDALCNGSEAEEEKHWTWFPNRKIPDGKIV